MTARVAIFGDYDVDGACSAALLAGFLSAGGAQPRIHIPDRLIEGYGPNSEAITFYKRTNTEHEPACSPARIPLR